MPKNSLSLLKKLNAEYILQFFPHKLSHIVEDKTLEYKGTKLKTMYIVDIVHSFISKYYFKKEIIFNLSSLILKSKYGKHYNKYIEFLLDSNIICVTKNYSSGNFCREYLLNENIINGKMSRIKNRDRILLRKYRERILGYINDKECSIISPDIKGKLTECLFDVTIDKNNSIKLLDKDNMDKITYQKNVYSIESIYNNNIFCHFDSYGRMHTNYTTLRSNIRKNCLSINGNELSELDIKNSQPLLLCKVIEENFKLYDIDETEYRFYKNLTHSGNFYQYIMDNTNISSLKEAKRVVYTTLFGENKSQTDYIFSSLFPSIFGFIKKYKHINKDHRSMAHRLQYLESDLIFNKIIKKIFNIYPEIKLITIHDSIMFEKKYENIIKDIFLNILKNEFNYDNVLSSK